MVKYLLFAVAVIYCSAAVGQRPLYWQPNSNWDNPENWNLGRQPCGGDVVSFKKVDSPHLIVLKSNVSIRRIQLPMNGKIVLTNSASIRFQKDDKCQGRDSVVAKAGENVFIGAKSNFWECPENWRTADSQIPASAPCGTDVAVFPEGSSFSFVNTTFENVINVYQLKLRGVNIKSIKEESEYGLREFSNLKVNLATGSCGTTPSNCPCIKGGDVCTNKGITSPESSSSTGGIVAGSVIAIILIIIIIIAVIFGVVWWMKTSRGSFAPYRRDNMEDEPKVTFEKEIDEGAINFDNPIYDESSEFSDLVPAEEVPQPTERGGGESDDLEKVPL